MTDLHTAVVVVGSSLGRELQLGQNNLDAFQTNSLLSIMVGFGRRIAMNFTQAFSWLIHQVPFIKLACMNSDYFGPDRKPVFGLIFSYISLLQLQLQAIVVQESPSR